MNEWDAWGFLFPQVLQSFDFFLKGDVINAHQRCLNLNPLFSLLFPPFMSLNHSPLHHLSFICVNINNLLWHPAGEEAENQKHKRKTTKTEQINVCSEITMNHKPIKPAWRDGQREEGRIGDSSNSQRRTERRLKIANSEWQHRNTFWIKDWNIKIGKQRACQKAKVVKYRKRWRGREKNKCKPLRINSLISLWGRIKKKRGFPPSDPLSLTLISLFPPVSYSNIFSLYSSYRNTFTRSANGVNTGTTPLDTKLTVASFLLPTSFFWNITWSFVIYFLTCPDWYVFHGATSSFNSNIRIHHIRTTWFSVAMVETINWLGGLQHKTRGNPRIDVKLYRRWGGGNSHARHILTLNYRHHLGRSQKLRRQILQTGSSAAFWMLVLEIWKSSAILSWSNSTSAAHWDGWMEG